jgi:hypothetical protein
MSRIQGRFEALGKAKRKALIPYITAGDPHPSLTVPLMRALVEAGADIIELGVPFSDPMADGPVVQRAGERALKHGVGLSNVLSMVKEFRNGPDIRRRGVSRGDDGSGHEYAQRGFLHGHQGLCRDPCVHRQQVLRDNTGGLVQELPPSFASGRLAGHHSQAVVRKRHVVILGTAWKDEVGPLPDLGLALCRIADSLCAK